MFEEVVKKLDFKVEKYPETHFVACLTDTKLKVDRQCSVTHSNGDLQETIMCDVLPFKDFHIIFWTTIDVESMYVVLVEPTHSFVGGKRK